jgi:acyl-CoA-binding protein
MYDSWMKWTKEGISQADAEKRYIELAEELCNKYLK